MERARIGIYSANGRAHDISVSTPNPHISAGLERVSTSNTQTDERVGGLMTPLNRIKKRVLVYRHEATE
jgi:hypothetical protein